MPQPITDDDALYYARAWRRAPNSLDTSIRKQLHAWVQAHAPSQVWRVVQSHLTRDEWLALCTEALAGAVESADDG